MRKINSKLLSAGLLLGCAFGFLALRVAWATPGSGLTATPIVGPVLVGDIDSISDIDGHEVEFKVSGTSDVFVTHLRFAPGGRGGWHYHPGPSIISVKAGEATFYQADDPETPHRFPAGTGFVEDAYLVHDVRNEGDTDLEIVVLQIVPAGAPRRIDAPAP